MDEQVYVVIKKAHDLLKAKPPSDEDRAYVIGLLESALTLCTAPGTENKAHGPGKRPGGILRDLLP